MEISKLIELRKISKSKRPEFLQQDLHKKKRLKKKWRKPKGVHSKIRHQFKGYRRRIKTGWKSPRAIRGFSNTGLKQILVHNVNDLLKINKNEGIIIGATVGNRKKLAIVNEAKNKNITILNIDADKFLENISKKIEDKKKTKEEIESKKKEKKSIDEKLAKEKEKELEKKKKEEEKKTDEEKKEEAKKEKDEVIIHTQQ